VEFEYTVFPAWPRTLHGEWIIPEGKTGLVSVILPTYDRAPFVRDAFTSCLQQTYRPLEVIVVDDGSTDDTANLVQQWQEDCATENGFTIRYVYQPNRGVSAARNLGLIQSQGEYIQYLDSDDVMHPQKIELHHAAMETAPRDHVWSESFMEDENIFSPFAETRQKEHDTNVLAQDAIDGPVPIAGAHKGFYRRAACYRIGPWNETLTRWEDKEYNLRLNCLAPRSAKVDAQLYKMRAHDAGSLTDTRTQAAGVKNGLRAVRAMERDLRAAESYEVPASFSLRGHYLKIAILALRVGTDAEFEECIRRAIDVSSSGQERLPLQGLRTMYRILGRRTTRWLQQTYTSHRLGR
jgi:glycosyltransferase involved in cell wall biosynthesis